LLVRLQLRGNETEWGCPLLYYARSSGKNIAACNLLKEGGEGKIFRGERDNSKY